MKENSIQNIIQTAFSNLKKDHRFFVSEADFQHSFAMKLEQELKGREAKVLLEFPINVNKNNKKIKIYIDIMLIVDKQMYPIELKYKTLKIKPEDKNKCYQETNINIGDILENQLHK